MIFYQSRIQKQYFVFIFSMLLLSIVGCSGHDSYNEKTFVGKWKSSKIETPVYLYDNGEWEIKTDEGGVLQYGLWELKKKKIIWKYKIGSNVGIDANWVISATPVEFRIEERDRSITTFKKLN